MRCAAPFVFALSAAASLAAAPDGYTDPALCAGCHSGIAASYARTGMGRSFYRPTPQSTVEDYQRGNRFYHEASDEHYTLLERGGRYSQRRHQLAPRSEE